MKLFYDLKIAVKLIISFVIVAALGGVVGSVGVMNIRDIMRKDTVMYENMTVPISQLTTISTLFQKVRVDTRDIILSGAAEDIKEQENSITQSREEIDKIAVEFENKILADDVKAAFKTFSNTRTEYSFYLEKLIQLAKDNKDTEAYALLNGDMARAAKAEQDAIDNLVKMKVDDAKETSDKNTDTGNNSITIMIGVVLVAMVASVVLGIFIAGMISRPVKHMADIAEKLAVGDINVQVKMSSKDEIGDLAVSFGKMIANTREQALAVEKIAEGDLSIQVGVKSDNDLMGKKLNELLDKNNEILENISFASEQVASGANQLSGSSMVLSQGATEQASTIEELTASVEEISSQTRVNAQNASEANQLSENAKETAMQGNHQMKEMLRSMKDINDASTSISKIIKVIDEIAFQTNILALNAAVEAARAGQHGKGFAVVAEEVRNLAAKSAQAAKETTDMIEGSMKKAEEGTRIANDTALALNHIVDEISKVANLVGHISEASNEQASGIAQINQGIMQVSQVVQNNSATSEEGAAASEELSGQATLLREMVLKFKLRQSSRRVKKPNGGSPTKFSGSFARQGELGVDMAAAAKSKIILSDRDFGKY